MSAHTQEFLGISAASEYMGVSPDTIRRRVSDGTIPASRLGRKILIRRGDLDAALRPIPSAKTWAIV